MTTRSPRSHIGYALLRLTAASTRSQGDFQLQGARLLGLLLVERLAVHVGHVRLVLDLISEGAHELLGGALALLAEKVLLPEMISQIRIVVVELIAAVGIAEVAEVVLTPQMPEQLVAVQVALLAVLTQRMAAMRAIVRIALAVVQLQLRLRVAPALEREDLEGLHAEVAVQQAVLAAHMVAQALERAVRGGIASGFQHKEKRGNHTTMTNVLL
ncbi:hypothetical protein M5D96_006929 [Drosophila gunungcola]|uniref:Uncharacterized protein n=1 Tax=Drosophila gunungcola TaxID=103775 RepID=A0A9Q0BP84_9MUSC|nr:hypothetical protein M5D96_006929 [Drosophila gunungcola]